MLTPAAKQRALFRNCIVFVASSVFQLLPMLPQPHLVMSLKYFNDIYLARHSFYREVMLTVGVHTCWLNDLRHTYLKLNCNLPCKQHNLHNIYNLVNDDYNCTAYTPLLISNINKMLLYQ